MSRTLANFMMPPCARLGVLMVMLRVWSPAAASHSVRLSGDKQFGLVQFESSVAAWLSDCDGMQAAEPSQLLHSSTFVPV